MPRPLQQRLQSRRPSPERAIVQSVFAILVVDQRVGSKLQQQSNDAGVARQVQESLLEIHSVGFRPPFQEQSYGGGVALYGIWEKMVRGHTVSQE